MPQREARASEPKHAASVPSSKGDSWVFRTTNFLGPFGLGMAVNFFSQNPWILWPIYCCAALWFGGTIYRYKGRHRKIVWVVSALAATSAFWGTSVLFSHYTKTDKQSDSEKLMAEISRIQREHGAEFQNRFPLGYAFFALKWNAILPFTNSDRESLNVDWSLASGRVIGEMVSLSIPEIRMGQGFIRSSEVRFPTTLGSGVVVGVSFSGGQGYDKVLLSSDYPGELKTVITPSSGSDAKLTFQIVRTLDGAQVVVMGLEPVRK